MSLPKSQIPKYFLYVIFTILGTLTGLFMGQEMSQSIVANIFAFLFGGVCGWVIVGEMGKIKGEITVGMLLGTIIGAILIFPIFYFTGIEKNFASPAIILLITLGAFWGLCIVSEWHEFGSHMKKIYFSFLTFSIVIAVIFFFFQLIEAFQAKDLTIIGTSILQSIRIILFLPIFLVIILASVIALLLFFNNLVLQDAPENRNES